MSLASNLTVKEDDNTTAHVFNMVEQPPNKPGVLRKNIDIDVPESESLLIQSSQQGKGIGIADRHSLTMDKVVSDVNGNLIRGYSTLSLVFPRSVAFTTQMMIDLLHQLLDVVVATSTFDVDDDTVKALLRGES